MQEKNFRDASVRDTDFNRQSSIGVQQENTEAGGPRDLTMSQDWGEIFVFEVILYYE